MTKRMRVFAGPNGSGKSSIIQSILDKKIDIGVYINADDIAAALNDKGIDFKVYKTEVIETDFYKVASKSGLITDGFSLERLKECVIFDGDFIRVDKVSSAKKEDYAHERIAQILADFLRKQMLEKGEKFSFETVFSHISKVEILKEAHEKGYKVYLYFVSTENPEINVHRVKIIRVAKDGHDVSDHKIRSRYYRSMDLMFEAAQYSYQAYFFDNSTNGEAHTMFAHFRIDDKGKKDWDKMEAFSIPVWFHKYYIAKVERKIN